VGLGNLGPSETFGHEPAFVDEVDDNLCAAWRDGATRPYHILATLDELATGAGRSPGARLHRARLRVVLAYGIDNEATLRETCTAVTPDDTSFVDVAAALAPETFEQSD